MGTVAVMGHVLLDLLSCRRQKGPGQECGGGGRAVLAETIGENDPPPPRYQAGLRYDIRRDGRLVVMMFVEHLRAY